MELYTGEIEQCCVYIDIETIMKCEDSPYANAIFAL